MLRIEDPFHGAIVNHRYGVQTDEGLARIIHEAKERNCGETRKWAMYAVEPYSGGLPANDTV